MMRKTYIINIDGMRADYFGATGHQGSLTPTLEFLEEKGLRFTKCKVPLPAVTATNHTSIMTSTNLGTHGIYGMLAYYKGLDFDHPKISSQYGTAQMDFYGHEHVQSLPTFLSVIKMNNLSAVTSVIAGKHWVGKILAKDCDTLIYAGNESNPSYVAPSEGYVLGGERHPGDSSWPPRIYIPKKDEWSVRPPEGTVKLPLKQINADLLPSDKWIIDQAVETVRKHDPDFMYILLPGMDIAGHVYGSFSDANLSDLTKFINPDAVKDQLHITDGEINRFITFLKSRYNESGKTAFEESRIVITSDHGMSSMKKWTKAVDIRKVLSRNGVKIKANTRWRPFGYNDRGHYEWCFSEGTHVYIYCGENVEEDIKKILEDHLDYLHEIFDKKTQREKGMWKGDHKDVIWPQLMVFLEANHYNKIYPDGYPKLASSPPHIQFLIAKAYRLPSAPGTHGTIFEQDVPLIVTSLGEIPGGVCSEEVSVLDIIPTINHLNEWPEQPSFEGELLPLTGTPTTRETEKPAPEPPVPKPRRKESLLERLLRWLFGR